METQEKIKSKETKDNLYPLYSVLETLFKIERNHKNTNDPNMATERIKSIQVSFKLKHMMDFMKAIIKDDAS